MIGATSALILALSPPPDAAAIDARIAASAAEAQALHGPLDGTWCLEESRGETLFAFEFADPVPGAGELQGAWRGSKDSAPGPIPTLARGDGRLRLSFTAQGVAMDVVLTRLPSGPWSGRARGGGKVWTVTLARPPCGPVPGGLDRAPN